MSPSPVRLWGSTSSTTSSSMTTMTTSGGIVGGGGEGGDVDKELVGVIGKLQEAEAKLLVSLISHYSISLFYFITAFVFNCLLIYLFFFSQSGIRAACGS